MAKRLTDTQKWNDDWYISLSNDYKVIWQWLLDNCSHAGVCKRSVSLLNLMCKTNFSEEEIVKTMEGRVIVTENNWFIPKFIKFQYVGLNSDKPVIKSVVKELQRLQLTKMIPESFGNDYLIIEKQLQNDYKIVKDKDKDKDKDNNCISIKVFCEKFSEDLTEAIFSDGTTQKLGKDQIALAMMGGIKPRDIVKGSIY